MPILDLLRTLEDESSVFVRAELVKRVPVLLDAGPSLWVNCFSHMHTRFNRYLFLNGPELWSSMGPQDWVSVMRALDDRSYSKGDVILTGRFDDIKFLSRFASVHAVRWFFETSQRTASLKEARSWVKKHVSACAFMYLPVENPDDELDDTHVSLEDLRCYGDSLARGAGLRPAPVDETQLTQELNELAQTAS